MLLKLIYLVLLSNVLDAKADTVRGGYISIDFIIHKLEYYYQDCGAYPSPHEGLLELVSSSKECWKGPYIKEKKLTDIDCNNKYKYNIFDEMHVEILSSGKDCIFNTDDDLRNTDSKSKRQIAISEYNQTVDFYILLKRLFALALVLMFLFLLNNRMRRKGGKLLE